MSKDPNKKISANHRRVPSNSTNTLTTHENLQTANLMTNVNNSHIQQTNPSIDTSHSNSSQLLTVNDNSLGRNQGQNNHEFMKIAQKVECTGRIPTARFGHIMVLVSSTKAVLFGGAVGDTRNFTITNDTFCFNIMTKIWTKLEINSSNSPCARAAHAACSNENLQLIVYGGSIGGGALANDEMFMLDLKNGDDEASWNIIQNVGKTPGKRYGHTLAFIKPHAIVFGGNTGTQPVNDVWIMSLEKSPSQWIKLDLPEDAVPLPRVYHACGVCSKGNASGMMLIFGGRDGNENALNDTWGLRRHRDGRWDWAYAPNKLDIVPKNRYNHYMMFVGSLMIITGGRSKNIQEIHPTEVYDTETSEWRRFTGIGLFRHMSFSKDNFLFIYGGFENTNPNNPVEKIFKIDLLQYFSSNLTLFQKLEVFFESKKDNKSGQQANNNISNLTNNHSSISSSQKNSIEQNSKVDKKFKLSNQVIVLKFNENMSEEAGFIRKVSIDKLNDEGKRIGFHNLRPDVQHRRVYNEVLVNKFIDTLLRPFDWFMPEIDEVHSHLPFTHDEIDGLLSEAAKVIAKDPTLVRIKSPVKVFGNIFGQYNDLMRFFESFGHPSDDNPMGDIHLFHYVFLGDYVDRGYYSLEVILLLLALKIRYPENIHLIRGHHEDPTININLGLGDECEKRLNDNIRQENSIFMNLNTLFELFPLGCLIDNKILCVHGGIGSSISKLSDIASIKRPIRVVQEVNTPEQQMVLDLLWSEYSDDVSEVMVNEERDFTKKGFMLKYGKDRLNKFINENNLMLIITTHQFIQEGMKSFANDKLLVVYSSTNYMDKYNNIGGIITINKNSTHIIPKLIDVYKTDKKNYRPSKNLSPIRK